MVSLGDSLLLRIKHGAFSECADWNYLVDGNTLDRVNLVIRMLFPAERGGLVEDRFFGGGVEVHVEVADAFELEVGQRLCADNGRFDDGCGYVQ